MTPTQDLQEEAQAVIPMETETGPEPQAGRPPSAVIKRIVPLSNVLKWKLLQVRGEVDELRVTEYREIIRRQGFMDGISAFRIDRDETEEDTWVGDGIHRIKAYEMEKVEKIPVDFRIGGRSEALLYGITRNGRHGMPMTNAQKRHAAEMAVLDPGIGAMPDKDIASRIGCSSALIASCRRGETKEAHTEKARQKRDTASKRETESTAPKSSTARERKPEDKRPTRAMIMRQVEDYLKHDCIEEADLLKLMQSAEGEYVFVPKKGVVTALRVVGKSGREQVAIKVTVKKIEYGCISLAYEGDGKVTLEE